jgi:hypothetical protein
MKIHLPKELSGTKFSRVLPIELNDFDIDRFLPALFFIILSEGRGSVRKGQVMGSIPDLINKLATHTSLQGFDSPEGRKLLERLVRTTLITTSSVGRKHSGEKVAAVVPYTLLAHKATENQRQRSVDIFIYQALKAYIGSDQNLQIYVKEVFGKGVYIGKPPNLGGSYDGKADLDTLTRLSIAFLDGFQNISSGINREKSEISACPALTKELATDLLRYLFVYYDLMPTQAFTYYLLALINFELFIYTLKLVYAINALVLNPVTLPLAMAETHLLPSPQIYVDFTDKTSNLSQEMAKDCVRRHMEGYQQFFSSNLLLRQLSRYVDALHRNNRWRSEIDKVLNFNSSGPLYLQGLLLLQHHPVIGPQIEASARQDEERIRTENSHAEDEDDENALFWLDDIANVDGSDVERVVALLSESQRGGTLSKYSRWFWEVGGMMKKHGFLSGTTRSRSSWMYAPSNDLLSVLVQLAASRPSLAETQQKNEKGVRIIRLQEFLTFLEERFGILVDRPPDQFVGAEYTAAARENLRAMLSRLRQMGIFRDLSDDFTVQCLQPPYTAAYLAILEDK